MIVVGMKTHFLSIQQVSVDKKSYLMVHIVDQREERDAARLYTEVAHHALGARKRELALVQAVLHVVDVKA